MSPSAGQRGDLLMRAPEALLRSWSRACPRDRHIISVMSCSSHQKIHCLICAQSAATRERRPGMDRTSALFRPAAQATLALTTGNAPIGICRRSSSPERLRSVPLVEASPARPTGGRAAALSCCTGGRRRPDAGGLAPTPRTGPSHGPFCPAALYRFAVLCRSTAWDSIRGTVEDTK